MEKYPLRTALIGCGAIAQQLHLPVLVGHPDINLVAIVEPNLERARYFAKGYNVPCVSRDVSELDFRQIEAAVIATPPFHHAPCAIELMEKGLHVLVEKPMAITCQDALKMVETAEKKGVILSVVFFRRLYPSFRLLKALVDAQVFGKVKGFHIQGGGFYNWPSASLGNMKKELAGGGVLIDFGSHMVDLMFGLLGGEVESFSYRDNARGGIESDCEIDIRLKYQDKEIEGKIELARTRNIGNFIRVLCDNAILEFQVNDRFNIKVFPRANELDDFYFEQKAKFLEVLSWEHKNENESWFATFARQYDDWLKAIAEKREPILSGRSGLVTVKLIEDCYANPKKIDEPWVETEESPNIWIKNKPNNIKKVFLTGATGFIGSRVAEILRLREGLEVRALVHNPGNASRLARLDVEMVQGDLGSKTDLIKLMDGCDAVIHCAIGTAWGEPKKIFDVTVEGTRRLASAALTSGKKRFIHVSTMSVYGDDLKLNGLLLENQPVSPVKGSIYGESKAKAEKVILDYVKKGLPAVIFRPARVFGPFSNIFITRPLMAMKEGGFEWLSSPNVPCDMVYVDNVVEAFLCALFAEENVMGEVFNIGDEDHSTWYEFYAYFAQKLGLDLPSEVSGQKTDVSSSNFIKSFINGFVQIITSAEFKSLGRLVLETDPVGTLPRKVFETVPSVEKLARKLVKADDKLPLYIPEGTYDPTLIVKMGSGGSVLSIQKLRNRLGYEPLVSRETALEKTLIWIKYAKIV